eukprot:TRINITY_DN7364_c0_g3_i5.p4 TRINITY_DN7364_c0_g3~~TRINITY_DN7364_c0_g3_i5.p4  ORF type:complete len:112 (-),score=16.03 TRINITY_DN7364_c0_g3_i5:438-773(-)
MHWTCAMVDLRNKRISYYDSLGGCDEPTVENLRKWVKDEFLDKKKLEIDENEFEIKIPKNIPRQLNGFDCGVFAIMYADYLASDRQFDFDQGDMSYFRIKLVNDLMSNIMD